MRGPARPPTRWCWPRATSAWSPSRTSPGRATREELEGRFPRLLTGASPRTPGIGFVLVRSASRGPVVLGGRRRARTRHRPGDPGPDPLAPFGPAAASTVLRADGFPHTADLMVNSAVDPAARATVHAFEEQAGSHGGLGGPQSHPFLLAPADLPLPAPPLVGAESLHALFHGWLAPREPGSVERQLGVDDRGASTYR